MLFRDFEQKIVKIINESGMSIDAVYYIMKSIMAEIEQRYFEFCRQEDATKHNIEMLKKIEKDDSGAGYPNKESNSEAEEAAVESTNKEVAK